MTCDRCRPVLEAYVDGELDVRAALEVETHLATCAACAARHATLRALSQSVRAHASRFAPGADFERRLRAASGGSQAGSPVPSRVRWRDVAIGVLSAAAIVLVWFTVRIAHPDAEHRIADEVVAAHVRSLLVDHLTDVASSDRHTVNPWFQGKIPFAVGARDLAARGYALEGGRLDYIDGRNVAALVYRHGPHALNVFVWPSEHESDAPLRRIDERGFHTAHWCRGGMQRWIVTDADESTVNGLVQLLDTPD